MIRLPITLESGTSSLSCQRRSTSLLATAAAFLLLKAGSLAFAADSSELLKEVLEQNRLLREQTASQQKQIDSLRERLDGLTGDVGERSQADAGAKGAASSKVIVSGEAGFAYFGGQSDGAFPHGEFRVDEAKLFLEAQVRPNTYVYTELNLMIRENGDDAFHLGECYLEFENLGATWAQDGLLNLRLGRLNIPFGEEYQFRDPIRNPLVTHTVADFWGIDEGVELYGSEGRFSYAVAVQNGGVSRLRDWNSDKSVVVRLGFDPLKWLHVSGSWMRTGDLDSAKDFGSELWVGNAIFRSIGNPATTKTFSVDLFQGDAVVRWRGGRLGASFGTARYDDNDSSRDNARNLDFFSVEGVQDLAGSLYGAVRYSRMDVKGGYNLPGLGNFADYFLGAKSTTELWRLGLGLGYRFNQSLNLKLEYTFEGGSTLAGATRDNQNQLAAEAGVKF